MAKGDLTTNKSPPFLGTRPGRRAQAVQRLQVGGVGLGVILLVIGVANVVMDRAQEVEQSAVPEAKLDTPAETENPASDPLAEIGVVPSPDPTTPTPESAATPGDAPKAPRSE